MVTIRKFKYRDPFQYKFWYISIRGKKRTVTSGYVGKKGRTRVKEFDTASGAKKEGERLIQRRLEEGYVEVAADADLEKNEPTPKTTDAAPPQQELEIDVDLGPTPPAARKLIDAIVERPDLPSRRLKYAAWLEKNGAPDRAEFIRLQCEIDEIEMNFGPWSGERTDRKIALSKAAAQLLTKNFKAWTHQLAPLNLTISDVSFRRGMINSVSLNSPEIDNNSLKVLAEFPEIESVSLAGTSVTDEGLKHLKPLRNLHRLTTSEAITAGGLKHLRAYQRLYQVYSSSLSYDSSELQSLIKIRNRAFDQISNAKAKQAEALYALRFFLYDPGFSCDEKGKTNWVSFVQSNVMDADLNYLTGFPELRGIYFSECKAITSKGMEYLASLAKLKELEMFDGVGVSDVRAIGKIRSLEKLSLTLLPEFDQGSVKYLAKLKNLKQLVLSDCGELTDEVIPHVAKIKSLTSLQLEGFGITDEGLKQLSVLPNLVELKVYDQAERKKLVKSILGASGK